MIDKSAIANYRCVRSAIADKIHWRKISSLENPTYQDEDTLSTDALIQNHEVQSRQIWRHLRNQIFDIDELLCMIAE